VVVHKVTIILFNPTFPNRRIYTKMKNSEYINNISLYDIKNTKWESLYTSHSCLFFANHTILEKYANQSQQMG